MAFCLTFVILLLFWIFMSGLFDLYHFGLGILSCALVAYMSHDLLFINLKPRKKLKEAVRFACYLPYLFYQILLANIYVAKLALHPKMSTLLQPHIVKFKTRLKDDLAVVTLANSITLTPGTITVLIEGDYFYVHSIDRASAESLPGELERRSGEIFEGPP